MHIKTIQWNIGGGKIRSAEASVDGPYDKDGMAHVIGVLKKYNPDIVTLQETHADDKSIQAEIIAKEIGFPYSINDVYDKSHIEDGQGLGQAIISRFQISEHSFKFFLNPHFETLGPDGSKWISHNKGVSKCVLSVSDDVKIQVATLHLIPFRKFEVDALGEELKDLRANIVELSSSSHSELLLQGDFNFDDSSLKAFLPTLFEQGANEVLLDKSTTPKGRRYDHVVYRGLRHIRSEVITDVLTDHFPVFSEFEI